MADVKWIKLSTSLFDNRKIKQIERMPEGDAIVVIWLKLLVLAGNVNDGGYVYFTNEIPYTEQLLSTEFNRPLPVIQLALTTFQKFGMIEIVEDVIHISNWEKYQSVDRMTELREYNRLAQQKSREKRKLLAAVNDVSMTSQSCQDTDIEVDIEEDKNKNKSKSTTRKRFTPPTIDEVNEYCRERGNRIDAQRFVDFYASKGWVVGKSPMKDWKAAIRTWEQHDRQGTTSSAKPNAALQYEQRNYSQDDLDSMYTDLSRFEQ